MTKYANKFFQLYTPEYNLGKNVTKYNPAPTNIGRSKDVDNSYLAATSVKKLLRNVIIIPLSRNKLSLFSCRRFEIIFVIVVVG